jgi:hypothetical protein
MTGYKFNTEEEMLQAEVDITNSIEGIKVNRYHSEGIGWVIEYEEEYESILGEPTILFSATGSI